MNPEKLLIQPEFDEREAWYGLARERGFGLELVSLAFPRILNEPDVARRHVEAYRAELAGFGGAVTMHGPFVDVIPHSSDRLVAGAARTRVDDCLRAAAEVGATHVVFHTGIMHHTASKPAYFDRAAERQAAFWRQALERFPGVTICLENMWEPAPSLLRRIVDGAAHPRLRVCLDVGHAHVYGRVDVEAWFEELGERIAYLHLNDNHGEHDDELPLGRGEIDWGRVFRAAAALPAEPLTVIEVARLDEVRESLRYLAAAGAL